jgi:hypothetical protein
MKILTYAGVLPCLLSVHVNVEWPRFILSMLVLAGLLWYVVYAFVKR